MLRLFAGRPRRPLHAQDARRLLRVERHVVRGPGVVGGTVPPRQVGTGRRRVGLTLRYPSATVRQTLLRNNITN
jgi:hypothetical protein